MNRILIVCVFVLSPGLASGQVCRGSAAVSATERLHGGASGTFAEVGNGVDGVVVVGSNAFVVAGRAGIEDYRGAHFFRTRLEGAPQLTAFGRRLVVCPGGTFSTGTTEVGERNRFEWALGLAASAGVVAVDRAAVQIIPAFTLVVEQWRARTWFYIYEDKITTNTRDVVSFGEAAVGVVLNRRFSITPIARFRIDDDRPILELTNAFRVAFTVRMGR